MKKPRIVYTKHALRQISIREIKEKYVLAVLENPQVTYASDKIPGAKKLIRKVNGKEVFVVALFKKNLVLIITAGWRD